MRRLVRLVASLAAVALFACEKPAAPAPPAPAVAPVAPVLPPPPTAAVVPDAGSPAPVTVENEVKAALEKRGYHVTKSESLPPIGRQGCRDESHERLVLANGFVDVSRFADGRMAEACLGAMRQQLAKAWPKIGSGFVVRGRFLGEIDGNLPPAERERIHAALVGAL